MRSQVARLGLSKYNERYHTKTERGTKKNGRTGVWPGSAVSFMSSCNLSSNPFSIAVGTDHLAAVACTE